MTATLQSSVNPSLEGQPVTLTAAIVPTGATGTVTFRDGSSVLATVAVAGGGAQFNTSSLSGGEHQLTATYNGDGNYAAKTSAELVQNVILDGRVVLAVASTEGDGVFSFSSPTPELNLSITSSGGSGQSSAASLNPGTYSVTASLPDGFGLTAITCSDGDSSGNVAAKTATISLSPDETVTCTFGAANSRKKTVEVIGRFLSQRDNMLLSNGPDLDRQIDRLTRAGEAAQQSGSGSGPGFADAGNAGAGFGTPSRLSGFAAAGAPLAMSGGTRERMSMALGMGQAADADQRGPQRALPISVSGSTETTTQLSFSSSLAQIRRSAAEARQQQNGAEGSMGPAMGLGMSSRPAAAPFTPFDIWVEGHYVDFSDDRSNQDSSGHFGVVYLGADYVVSTRLLVGVLVQYDSMQQSSDEEHYKIEGNGWMAGPYATARLTDNVFLQGRAAWGSSSNTVSPFNTYSDEFGTDRWLVDGRLTGRWQYGAWSFRPSASLSYIEDKSEAYADSLGVVIPGLATSLGQFKAGPEVAYTMRLSDGMHFEPRASFEALWNFGASDHWSDFGGTLAGPAGVRGKVGLGLKAQLDSGIALDISGSYDGIGSSNFSAVGGRISASVPLD